jgi:hypothetical protein
LSADRTGSRRSRVAAGCAVLALLAGASACAGEADAGAAASPTPTGTPADATTRALAEVEFQRQCAIGSQSFADEAGITADLDARLAAVGLTHQQWKEWHDDLVDSPELVAQVAEISAAGCPAG